MHSPFHRRKHDSAALVLAPGLGMQAFGFPRRGLGMSAVASAIAQAEGFGQPGAIPTIANNPGDLELGNIGSGVTIAAGGQQITNFPTLEAGEAALENQVNLIATGTSKAGYSPSMSIAQVGQLYSGGSSNWANNVAAALGVDPSTNFASVVSGSPTPTISDSTAGAEPVSRNRYVQPVVFGTCPHQFNPVFDRRGSRQHRRSRLACYRVTEIRKPQNPKISESCHF